MRKNGFIEYQVIHQKEIKKHFTKLNQKELKKLIKIQKIKSNFIKINELKNKLNE